MYLCSIGSTFCRTLDEQTSAIVSFLQDGRVQDSHCKMRAPIQKKKTYKQCKKSFVPDTEKEFGETEPRCTGKFVTGIIFCSVALNRKHSMAPAEKQITVRFLLHTKMVFDEHQSVFGQEAKSWSSAHGNFFFFLLQMNQDFQLKGEKQCMLVIYHNTKMEGFTLPYLLGAAIFCSFIHLNNQYNNTIIKHKPWSLVQRAA